jgi:hypothetical protein
MSSSIVFSESIVVTKLYPTFLDAESFPINCVRVRIQSNIFTLMIRILCPEH